MARLSRLLTFAHTGLHCLLFCAAYSAVVSVQTQAQQVETTLPLSQRVAINLDAGMPAYIGNATASAQTVQNAWWYENTNNSPSYSSQHFTESADGSANWQQVGLPYDANISRTFINQTSGGGQGSLTGNENWYRLHFLVDPKYNGQRFQLELEGAHTGVQVYINGQPLYGVSAVTKNAQATHVIGFVPVIVDLTKYIKADGQTENVIAIDVSRGSSWFEQPGFSGAFRFGQAMAGLFRNVKLFVTNPVYIPENVYSNQQTWGTYVNTLSITPTAGGTGATADSAVVDVQTNIVNQSATLQMVTLTTQIVDAKGNVVATAVTNPVQVAPSGGAATPSGAQPIFDQQITVSNPTLWYPNGSTYGKPYLYHVYHIVSVNGVVVDSKESTLGIRTITWDANFPFINGYRHVLWGGSGRYDYPGLGSSVPDEQVWRDLQQFAAAGGNIWRPGHSTSSEEFVDAADAYGIFVIQPSGDGEGYFNNPTADDQTLKQELHRDMIIRDRSHPSILYWEEDNGGNNPTLAAALDQINTQWDNVNPRKQASRAYLPSYAYIDECDGAGCEVGNKTQFPNNPAFGAEYWNTVGTGRGLGWDSELTFAAGYLKNWHDGRAANSFGMAQWYFADTPGEIATTWPEFGSNQNLVNYTRSLGYSMVDQNRFPRLLYYIYASNWLPYSVKPVVALAHHWNRAYESTAGTPVQVNAFSNCPAVRLLVNGVAKDPVSGVTLQDQVPNPWTTSPTDLTQSTTTIAAQVHWMVNWEPGNITAECLDATYTPVAGVSDTRVTAGQDNRIVLKVVPNVVKPDGTSFQWTANGSDAAFIEADVVDAQGNLDPIASQNVTFSVSGPATYMGGTQQLVADPSTVTYYQDAFSKLHSKDVAGLPYGFFHSPGDPELNFEGGLQKVAVRSTLTPGTVTVTATAPGLQGGSVQLTSVAMQAPVQTQGPVILVPPVAAAVTSGYDATFSITVSGSGSLGYQWLVNGQSIPGATGMSYTTPPTTSTNDGQMYAVTVTSSYGTVTSAPVRLSVSQPQPISITTQPASQTVVVGQTAVFSVAASGSPQLKYTWFNNGQQVSQGAASTYTTAILTVPGTQNIAVTITNPLGTATSNTAVLTVTQPQPVSFTAQPQSQVAAINQPVVISATASGSQPFSYQWTFTAAGGAATILTSGSQAGTTFTYSVPAMTSADVGAYTLTVNNAANAPAISAAALLTLAPPGINLAYARTATASSTQTACADATTAPPLSGTGCLGAENAVDGDLTDRWGSAVANAPPTPGIAGVDPSWLVVDLGSTQPFNTAIINWEAAYATQYEIDYTNDNPTSADANWQTAVTNNVGAGQTETLSFSTVQARYVRLLGTQRSGNYGYSVHEFEVYNLAQCGGSAERYSVVGGTPSVVKDNLLGLTWTQTVMTNPATGSQFTGANAAAYCSSIGMRLPSQAEALSISGNNNASCAVHGAWNTWTSTVDPNDATETALVGYDSTVTQKVTNNWPGETLCVQGNSAAQPVAVMQQPQPTTVTLGKSAIFTVMATGMPAPTYQWQRNGQPIANATEPIYITPATTTSDDQTRYSVLITNSQGSLASASSILSVSTTPVTAPGTGTGPGNTGSGDTAVPGFGVGPVPRGPNLAKGQTVLSSADENEVAFVPRNVVDGDLTTRWSSGFTDNQWIQVDLGSAQSIGQVVLRWERAFGSQYQVQTSLDAVNWTLALTQSNGQGGSENLVFPAITARYVRMNGVKRAQPSYGYSLWELEVYGPVGPSIITQPANQTVAAGGQAQFTVVAGGQPPFTYQWMQGAVAIAGATSATYTSGAISYSANGSQYSVVVTSNGLSVTSSAATLTVTNPTSGTANLALFKPATSSGEENANLAPQNAVDGDLTTRFASEQQNDSAWIQIDLTQPLLVNKVVLNWEAAYGKQYLIQMSNDAQTWTTVYTQSAGQGGVESLSFPGQVGRYLRMQGVQRATQYGYSLYELQAFGSDVPAFANQPADQAVVAGTAATFSVTASGDGPFSYQWQRNGLAIAGATGTSFQTKTLESGDSGSTFSVNVINASGSTLSRSALLTVTSAVPSGPNLALGRPAYASGTENNDPALAPNLATDGSLTTRWSSLPVDSSYLYVDLGQAQTINQIILRWETAYGKQYQIRTSADALNWTTVLTRTNGLGGTENLSFAPVTARYVGMYGVQRGTPYGYSLYEFEAYGPNTVSTITQQPANQSANVGQTATFSVGAGGNGPFTYQWFLNGTAITGATGASYTTPLLSTSNNGGQYKVVVGSTGTAPVTSSTVTLSVANYTIYPGLTGTDLVNNTKGSWTNNQIYVTVLGINPADRNFAYVTPTGQIVDFTANDVNASNHLTENGVNFGNYSFTLAQSPTLLLPPISSGRIYISLGAPLYVSVYSSGGVVTGFAGPNPQNPTDPNLNTHYDWYEFSIGNGIFINTTQVDQFGLPLMLDVWGNNGTFHQQVGVTESIAQIDQEFSKEVPAAFQPATMSNLRILSPAKLSMAAGGSNGNYFDAVIANAWAGYARTPITISLFGRQFSGQAQGSTLTFTEVNPGSAHAGETFVVMQPSTQDVLLCAGTMNTGNPAPTDQGTDMNNVQLQLENKVCSAINRGVLNDQPDWANAAAYYATTPYNSYSAFWHRHSLGGLAYGFAYDDNNNQSTTVTTPSPEHVTLSIGW